MTEKARTYSENVGKPPIKVKHADLKRDHDESVYRSKCPACPEGVLLVMRNQETAELEALDFCIVCGQAFIYTDIAKLRKREGL